MQKVGGKGGRLEDRGGKKVVRGGEMVMREIRADLGKVMD